MNDWENKDKKGGDVKFISVNFVFGGWMEIAGFTSCILCLPTAPTAISTTNEKLAFFQSICSKFIVWDTVISSHPSDLFSRLDHLPGLCSPGCLFCSSESSWNCAAQMDGNTWGGVPERGGAWGEEKEAPWKSAGIEECRGKSVKVLKPNKRLYNLTHRWLGISCEYFMNVG